MASVYEIPVEVYVDTSRIGYGTVYVRAADEDEALEIARTVTEDSHLWDDRIHGKWMDSGSVSELDEADVPESEEIHSREATSVLSR